MAQLHSARLGSVWNVIVLRTRPPMTQKTHCSQPGHDKNNTRTRDGVRLLAWASSVAQQADKGRRIGARPFRVWIWNTMHASLNGRLAGSPVGALGLALGGGYALIHTPGVAGRKCKGFRCSCAWWQSCSLQNRFRPLSRRLHPRHRRSHRLPSTLLVPLTRPLHLNRHHRPRLHPRLHPSHHHALLRRPNHRP